MARVAKPARAAAATRITKAKRAAKPVKAVKALKVEEIPRSEKKMIAQISEMTKQLQIIRAKSDALGQNGEVLRGVHPKSHGCLVGRFTVNPKLRKRLRVGLFREPGRTFKCRIRLSNATTSIAPDLAGGNGTRGFALKVLDAGRRAIVKDQGQVSQDFLLINTNRFAFANVADYLRATQALMSDPNGVDGRIYFLPAQLFAAGVMDASGKIIPPRGEEPPEVAGARALFEQVKGTPLFKGFGPVQMAGTLKSAAVLQQILAEPVRNPLEVAYFAAAPTRFGARRVARFRVEPLDGPVPQAPITAEEAEALGPDYLAKAVARSMARGAAITFRMRAQVIHPIELEDRIELIEDATVAWDPEEFEPVDLAKITIDPSDQPRDLVDACKADRFTPWQCLPAHEPVGGINRLRRPVYEASSGHRS